MTDHVCTPTSQNGICATCGEPAGPACPFCAIVAVEYQPSADERRAGIVGENSLAKVVLRRRDVLAFHPLNPVTPGHLLVIPKRHLVDALESPTMTGEVFATAAELAEIMRGTSGSLLGIEGFNLITSVGEAATQTVRHLHVHVIPRRPGDRLALPWTGRRDPAPEWLS